MVWDGQDPVGQVLVVRAEREADSLPLLRQVWGRPPEIGKLRKSVVRAWGWKHPRAPRIRTLFEMEETTPAVLTFLRDTRVGKMVSLAALGGGGG